MKQKYSLRARNETGDTTIDVQEFVVPDSAITAGSGVVSIAAATGDVTGPASATDNAITRYNGTTGKTVQNSAAFVDDNGNVYAPNIVPGLVSIVSSGTPVALVVASKGTQVITGSTAQTITLPVVTTLPQIGFQYLIVNDSTAAVTVNSSGGNLVQTIAAGGRALITCTLLTGTSAASWASNYTAGGNAAANIGYLNIPQQTFSAAYPIVLADSGKHLYHPASDANARQVTIPANASVAFPLGTAISIVNDSANDVTVIITTDVLTYANVGTITTLTIPQYNQATILKVLTTQWNASGSAGCTTA